MPSQEHVVTTLQEWIEIFMRRSMRNFILHSKKSGMSMSQIGALFYLFRQGAAGVSDIGDDLGITSAAASQMIERLAQQKLIIRSEDPHDRRGKQITLTERGRQAMRESLHARQKWLDEVAARLSPAEQEQVIAALRILIEKSSQVEQPPGP